jgi:hypothetical protein
LLNSRIKKSPTPSDHEPCLTASPTFNHTAAVQPAVQKLCSNLGSRIDTNRIVSWNGVIADDAATHMPAELHPNDLYKEFAEAYWKSTTKSRPNRPK